MESQQKVNPPQAQAQNVAQSGRSNFESYHRQVLLTKLEDLLVDPDDVFEDEYKHITRVLSRLNVEKVLQVPSHMFRIGHVHHQGWTIQSNKNGNHMNLRIFRSVDWQNDTPLLSQEEDAGAWDLFLEVLSIAAGGLTNPFAPNVAMLFRSRDWLDVLIVLWDISLKCCNGNSSAFSTTLSMLPGSVEPQGWADFEVPQVLKDINVDILKATLSGLGKSSKVKSLFLLLNTFVVNILGYNLGLKFEDVKVLLNNAIECNVDTVSGAIMAVVDVMLDFAKSSTWTELLNMDSQTGVLLLDTSKALEPMDWGISTRTEEIAAYIKLLQSLEQRWMRAGESNAAMRSASTVWLPRVRERIQQVNQLIKGKVKVPGMTLFVEGAAGIGKTGLTEQLAIVIRSAYSEVFDVDVNSEATKKIDIGQKYFDPQLGAQPLVLSCADPVNTSLQHPKGLEQAHNTVNMIYKIGDSEPMQVATAEVAGKQNELNSVVGLILSVNEDVTKSLMLVAKDENAFSRRSLIINYSLKPEFSSPSGTLDVKKAEDAGTEDYWTASIQHLDKTGTLVTGKFDDVAQLNLYVRQFFVDHFRSYLRKLDRDSRSFCTRCAMPQCRCVEPQAMLGLHYTKFEHLWAFYSLFGVLDTTKLIFNMVKAHIYASAPWVIDLSLLHYLFLFMFMYCFGLQWGFILILLLLSNKGVKVERHVHDIPWTMMLLPSAVVMFFVWWRTRVPNVETLTRLVKAKQTVNPQGGTMSRIFDKIDPHPTRESSREVRQPLNSLQSKIAFSQYEVKITYDGVTHDSTWAFLMGSSMCLPKHSLAKMSSSKTYVVVFTSLTKPNFVKRVAVRKSDFMTIAPDIVSLPSVAIGYDIPVSLEMPTHVVRVTEEDEVVIRPIQCFGAQKVKYPDNSVVDVIAYNEQGKGLCGLVGFNSNGVVGMHVAGNESTDIGCLMRLPPIPSHLRVLPDPLPPSGNAPVSAIDATTTHYVGTERNFPNVIRSKIVPDEAYPNGLQDLGLTIPKRRAGVMYEGQWMTPFTPWLEPKPTAQYTIDVVDEVFDMLKPVVLGFPLVRKLTLYEAINGVPGLVPSMNMQTSAGPGMKPKLHYVVQDATGQYHPTDELTILFAEYGDKLCKGDIGDIRVSVALKDELVTLSKDARQKVRSFFVMPFLLTLWTRVLFSPLIEALKRFEWFAVGMNVFTDWDTFHRRIMETGRVANGDIEGLDRRGHVRISKEIWEKVMYVLANELCHFSDTDEAIARSIINLMVAPVVVNGGDVYVMEGVNPSGAPSTTIYNCIVVMCMLVRACHIAGVQVSELRASIFGDDSCCGMPPGMTQHHIAEAAAEYGYVYTSSEKSKELEEFETNPKFLRRESFFHPELGEFVGRLEMNSILKSLTMIRGDSALSYDEYRRVTIRNASMELALWGREVHETQGARLLERFNKFADAFTPYDECIELYKQRKYTSTLFEDFERISRADIAIE